MLTSKQRAILRSEASKIDAIFQIGKGGIGETVIKTVSDALEARELIKITVLENCDSDIRTAAEELAGLTGAEVVAVIGRKIVLYKQSTKENKQKYSLMI